ncbi:transcriptional repressor [Paenibacillus sp. S3N08]|uniref:Transcriptional repressor n=1 Tax=Paenibacillus agricola TaxID=2716264 RepID=A0ABX0J7Z5_9BACL|nr:transcriptional repressor [Paenibacillus agricola]
MQQELEKINQQLIRSQYKMTHQREATIRILLENEEDHLSAEKVYMLVKEKNENIGLATVYRTLELLCDLHIVEKMNFGDGVSRYDLRSDEHEHMHHHMICQICLEVKEIKDDWLKEIELRVQKEYGFKVSDHRLDFMGVYNNCNGKDCKKEDKLLA